MHSVTALVSYVQAVLCSKDFQVRIKVSSRLEFARRIVDVEMVKVLLRS